jgi:mannosyltransferase OCH1-like enzyme
MCMLFTVIVPFLFWFFYQKAQRLCLSYKPATDAVVQHGQSATLYRPIPKIIWSYWHQKDQPLIVQKCIDTWRRYNPDYSINVLHTGNINEFIPTDQLPDTFFTLKEFRKADWLRIALLQTYGGIWLDASIVLTQPLDWAMDLQQKNNSEFVGFYIDGFSTDKERPVIENWFMASVPQSGFITDWCAEFTHEVINRSASAYLTLLRNSRTYEEVVQNIKNPEYLAMHVAASRVTRKKDAYSLTLIKAEETAFFYLSHLQWSRVRLFIELALLQANSSLPALIKLRRKERNLFARGLQYKVFRSSSVIGRYLIQEGTHH